MEDAPQRESHPPNRREVVRPVHDHGPHTTGDPLRELLADGVLRDAWSVAGSRLTPEWGTHPDYRAPRMGASRIDWIAVTSGVEVRRAAINARRVDGEWPSDHLPVQVEIRIPWEGGNA